MTETKWCVIYKTKTKTKSEFAVKINTAPNASVANSWMFLPLCNGHCIRVAK